MKHLILTVAAVAFLCLPLHAGENMIGRQSQNEGILVLPAPASGVKIDGDLSDWDWSGRIWCFADESVRGRFSVEVAAMWDKDNLYVAAKWKDATPMYSTVDPEFNPDDGWKSDSLQLRLRTTDRISHITTWYYSPKDEPVVHVDYGKDLTHPFGGSKFWVGKPGSTQLGRGIELAYKKDADGLGYAQEIKIPWSIVCESVPAWKANDTFRLGMEFLWGDVSGKTWPIHRYADNMQPGKTSREFYFYSYQNWGDAQLLDHGHVPVRRYIGDVQKIEGSLPVRVDIPADAARFTVVIDDTAGKRVRNLAADCDPNAYAVEGAGVPAGKRRVEVAWDCRDERGTIVPAGTYHARGLTQRGLSAEYESYFYNPGTPPWQTQDGSGAWGADHSGPNNVAAGGDWTVITCPVIEGGSGLFGIDPDGRKRWGGEKRGFSKVTADDKYIYGYVTWGNVKQTLCRFDLKTGAYRPFLIKDQPRPFDLPLKDIIGDKGDVTAMTVHKGTLALAMSGNTVELLDAASAEPAKSIAVPNPAGLAFDDAGTLYVWADGKLARLDAQSGALAPIATPGVGKAAAIACDRDGNIVVADAGPDSQVKAFSPAGQPVYTCGVKGGRPLRGAFNAQAMVSMSSVAVDSKNRVWVTENTYYPRRVSVWSHDGSLVRDYIGNTGYAGTACYLHDSDPSLAFCGPLEFHRDAATPGGWKLTDIMWLPDRAKGESFEIRTDSQIQPERFTSSVSGQPHEYLYTHEPDGQVVFVKGSDGWKPRAAIALAGYVLGEIVHDGRVVRPPGGELAGVNAYDIVFWNDKNKDGIVQRDECQIIPAAKPASGERRGEAAFRLTNGWGGRIAPDLTLYMDGIAKYKPDHVDPDGAPSYSPQGRTILDAGELGDLVPVPDEKKLLCLSFKGYAGETSGLLSLDDATGAIEWSYRNRFPGVHGSHDAPMPTPGMLIGPLKICGLARIDDTIGNVMLLRGNLGQDFLYTTDGLYVGALFQDGRLPADDFPPTLEKLKGMPMESFTEGGEPFNGWFGKQSDGVVRLTTGMAREAGTILHVGGLDTIRRFDAGAVEIDDAALASARAFKPASAQAASAGAAAHKFAIAKTSKPLPADGQSAEWNALPALSIARPGLPDHATVRLAYDQTHLYAMFDVTDSTPWRNEGKDFSRLFKTGDAVDIQLGTNPDAPAATAPQAGDLRIVISQLNGKPVAVLMQPIDPAAPESAHQKYTSPVGTKSFDRVEVLEDAKVAVNVLEGRYVVTAAIPLADLHLKPHPGVKIRGDVGFISSNAAGTIDVARTYWANQHTNLVNDMPIEAWMTPDQWGEFEFR
jgi:hypothetical protein